MPSLDAISDSMRATSAIFATLSAFALAKRALFFSATFARVMHLEASLKHIDAMPQGDFEKIIEKYVEMNMAHPFREGNGRATRIWLDLILKKEIHRVIDWNQVNKEDYLSAMERSVVKDLEIKMLLKQALTDQIHDRALFMKGIDVSYYYEGYSEFRIEDL